MLSEGRVRRIHTHTLYILPAFLDVSRHRYPFVILIPLVFFLVFFFLPLDINRPRGESSFRPEPLGKPPYEPSRVDIQFYYNSKKVYTDIPLELPKDDQGLLLQGFNDVLSPKRDDGTEEIFFHERKVEKRFAGPEIKMPHMRTSVLQPL